MLNVTGLPGGQWAVAVHILSCNPGGFFQIVIIKGTGQDQSLISYSKTARIIE